RAMMRNRLSKKWVIVAAVIVTVLAISTTTVLAMTGGIEKLVASAPGKEVIVPEASKEGRAYFQQLLEQYRANEIPDERKLELMEEGYSLADIAKAEEFSVYTKETPEEIVRLKGTKPNFIIKKVKD